MSIYEAAVATVFIRNLLKEMGIETPMATIHEDNDGTRRLAMNDMGQGKARHLMAKHHYVQDLCRDGEIVVQRASTNDQPADLLTKGSHTEATFS